MRAVWYERNGAATQVLVTGDMPTPIPAAGEVLVRLHASGINPADTYWRKGTNGPMAGPRVIPNSDGAGIVEAVGPGVDQAWVGQRVWLYNGQRGGRAFGTAAEYIALDADLVSLLPPGVSFAEGATLGIPCMTAHRSLFVAGPVQGRTVLVTGGAGAVGHYAVQLARWAGATVIATVSSEDKAAHATAGGADHTIDYKREDVAARIAGITGGKGVDHVVDVDFAGNLAATLAAVRDRGSIATYASITEREPTVPVYQLIRKNLALHAVYLATVPHEARKRAQSDITAWLRSGRRILTVAARFTLPETAHAHELVEAGGKLGTVVVEP